jgi:predicted dehydrogenase
MPARLRLGVAGLVHDHVWSELKCWAATGRVEIVAVADRHEPLRQRAREEFGVERFFDDPRAMLDECDLNFVEICTSNADALPVVQAAAAQGVHCKIEKPMAASLADADAMLAAVEQSGSMLMINWPNRWRPNTPQAWRLVQEGAVGRVFTARVRMAHGGPRELGCSEYFCDWLFDATETGSGALIDYCSYGAAAFAHLFGRPNAVQAAAARLTKQDIDVVDNAVITCLYDDKIGFTEASWSQIPSYHDAMYFGTAGTLWTEPGKLRLARGREGEFDEIDVEPLPEGRRNGPEYMLWCLDHGEPPGDTCSARVSRDAQEIMEAGLIAAESGTRVSLPLGP